MPSGLFRLQKAMCCNLCRLLIAEASLQGLLPLQVQGSRIQYSRTARIGSQEGCQARDLKEQDVCVRQSCIAIHLRSSMCFDGIPKGSGDNQVDM